ncbi:hypothetical protein MBLNU459_g3424t2 [Dothideomycetes sp. NU459]
MAWPHPFRVRTPNTRSAWGYMFELTDEHITPEEYNPLKYSYDVLGEEVLNRVNEISPPPSELPRNQSRTPEKPSETTFSEKVEGEKASPQKPRRDLYALVKEHAHTDPILERFWKEVNTVPSWVDWEQIARGQDVFYRYGGANLTGLAYQSLLGGMGAARVVETLARTGGFSTKSLESIQPGGEGFASTIRVRLLHAAVRNRIMTLTKTKPGYYNVEEWGVPINDIDSIGTITTFSSSLIWLSLPRQGIWMRQQEIEDYIALWRYIAYVIGCPTEGFFETWQQAKRTNEALLLYEVQPSATSRIMANNIIRSLQDQPPGYASADFLVAGARWLNGNDLSDALGLPRPSPYYWALMAGQCIFFAVFSYAYRAVPAWDRQKIAMLRRVFWTVVVESKYGLQGEETNFDFKYVPEYSTITEMGESNGAVLQSAGVEARNLKTLIVATGVLGISLWCTVKAGVGAFHVLRWAVGA